MIFHDVKTIMFIICVGKPIKYISFNYICREGINGSQIAIHFLKFTVFEDLKTQFLQSGELFYVPGLRFRV